jgi:type I restriction enzyme, S subunit
MNAERLLAHYERIADAPDAISRLRRFILDLAVRGKLVPQDPKDAPASELLKRIAKEKAWLVKAGDLRKPRDLDDGGALEEPFAIPVTWQWARLDAIGAIVGGGTPSATDVDNFAEPGGGTPLLTPADLGGYPGLYISRGARDLSEKGLRTSSATMMPAGTVLFSSRAPIGYVAIAVNPISTNQGFKSIVPYVADCSHFIATAMKAFASEIDAKAPGTTFKEVSGKIVAAIPFPLPPLAEQHRIVAKVDELMALCDRLEAARAEREATRDQLTTASLARLNAPDPATFQDDARFALETFQVLTTRPDQIKQLRETILNLAVRGKLVPQDLRGEPASELLKRIAAEKARLVKLGEIRRDQLLSPLGPEEEPFDLPAPWMWCRLRSLASTLGDGLHGTPSYTEGSNCYFINGNNLNHGKIVIKENTKTVSLDEMRKYKKPLSSNSVLVSINGTLGNVAFYNNENVILGKSACYFNLTEFSDKAFAKIVLESPYFVNYALQNATGTTIMNLSLKAMNEFPFPVPPLTEQRRIVAKVDELMALCDRLEASLTTCDDARRRLLNALLAEALVPEVMPAEAVKIAAHG